MKRIVILVLAMMFLSIPLAQAGWPALVRLRQQFPSEYDLTRESRALFSEMSYENNRQHLACDWEILLATTQQQNKNILWALDYLQDYTNNPTWDSLTYARMASLATATYLQELVWPQYTLTDQQIDALFDQNVAVELLADYPNYDLRYLSARFRKICVSLNFNWNEDTHITYIINQCAALRHLLAVEKDYFSAETNYLLLTCCPVDEQQDYWSALIQLYPTVLSTEYIWMSDVLELEKINPDLRIAFETARDYQQQDVYATDISMLKNDLYDLKTGRSIATVKVTGTPTLINMPEWYDPETAYHAFHYYNADGKLCKMTAGDPMPETFSSYLRQDGVTLADVEAWIAMLLNFGYPVQQEDTKWYIFTDEYDTMIEWENNTVSMYWRNSTFTLGLHY